MYPVLNYTLWQKFDTVIKGHKWISIKHYLHVLMRSNDANTCLKRGIIILPKSVGRKAFYRIGPRMTNWRFFLDVFSWILFEIFFSFIQSISDWGMLGICSSLPLAVPRNPPTTLSPTHLLSPSVQFEECFALSPITSIETGKGETLFWNATTVCCCMKAGR